jgi:hypothetical protein
MLPALTDEGLLPAGIHEAEWSEIWVAFGTTPYRKKLLRGFLRAVEALKAAGCRRVYLDGSFVTAKETPGDFDACWDPDGVEFLLLDPILLTFDHGRLAQKVKYGGELFPASTVADHGSMSTFIEFFQIHKETGAPKGIIAMDLERDQP